MRASIDCPHCPTSTRSSIIPCRSGPNRSSQGGGRASAVSRNARGTDAQEDGKVDGPGGAQLDGGAVPPTGSPGSPPQGLARRPIVESLLSETAPSCHDIWLNGEHKGRS